MSSSVRLSVVCLSVTFVHPTAEGPAFSVRRQEASVLEGQDHRLQEELADIMGEKSTQSHVEQHNAVSSSSGVILFWWLSNLRVRFKNETGLVALPSCFSPCRHVKFL